MKLENQNKPWTQEEDQILINVFKKCKYDKTTVTACYGILGRSSSSIRGRLSILRKEGLIENSKFSVRRLNGVKTMQAKRINQPIIKETMEQVKQPIVQEVFNSIVQDDNAELLNLALLIANKLNKTNRFKLVESMLA